MDLLVIFEILEVNPKCKESIGKSWCDSMTLGALRIASKAYKTITKRSVFYRCVTCRMKYAINRGSLVFPPVAGGYGVTERILAYWNLVHGASATFTGKQLNLSEDAIKSFYKLGRIIICEDNLRRQSSMVFGARGPETTDIEIDEHSFCNWTIDHMHYFFVWIGIQQRGEATKFWMMPLVGSDPLMRPGVTHSTDEARVPPLCLNFLEECLDVAFTEHTNAVLMSDSAISYQVVGVGHPAPDQSGRRGVVEKHLVNHNRKPVRENTRSVEITANIEIGEKRAGTAGTQGIDGTWRWLEDHFPRSLNCHRDEQTWQTYVEYVRFAQWLVMLGTEDKWAAFCEAVKHYETRTVADKVAESSRGLKRSLEENRNEEIEAKDVSGAQDGGDAQVGDIAPQEAGADAVVLSTQGPTFAYGEELLNEPLVNWASLLGYRIDAPEHGRLACHFRGCVNLEMKHCYAISLLRALGACWRFQSWCSEHRHLCKDQDCLFCMLDEDLRQLSLPDRSLYTPLITAHRSDWAPDWPVSRQECAMEAFEKLLTHCHMVDKRCALQLELESNQAAQRTYPNALVFGGLSRSERTCHFATCRRKSSKVQESLSISVNIPHGGVVTVKVAIEQAQSAQQSEN